MGEISCISRCPICREEMSFEMPDDLGVKAGTIGTILCRKCEGQLFAACKYRKTAEELRDLIALGKNDGGDIISKRRQAIALARVLVHEVVAA